jgi:hypothetical protein
MIASRDRGGCKPAGPREIFDLSLRLIQEEAAPLLAEVGVEPRVYFSRFSGSIPASILLSAPSLQIRNGNSENVALSGNW